MSYEHLNARERMCIFYQRQMGHSMRAIASYLGRSRSTISRELARNNRPYIGTYCDRYAQSHAEQRKAISSILNYSFQAFKCTPDSVERKGFVVWGLRC